MLTSVIREETWFCWESKSESGQEPTLGWVQQEMGIELRKMLAGYAWGGSLALKMHGILEGERSEERGGQGLSLGQPTELRPSAGEKTAHAHTSGRLCGAGEQGLVRNANSRAVPIPDLLNQGL